MPKSVKSRKSKLKVETRDRVDLGVGGGGAGRAEVEPACDLRAAPRSRSHVRVRAAQRCVSMSSSKQCFSSDGAQIYADAAGNAQNPSMVFAHGFALSGVVFDQLFAHQLLLDNFYLVRYDVRGYGRSSKPDDSAAYQSALYADDFSAVCQAFGLVKPIFVGWSAGAPIIADICAHISPCPILAAVAMSGALCPATSEQTLRPLLLDFIAKFRSSDAKTTLAVRPAFVDACFVNPASVAVEVKTAWIGATVVHTPNITEAVLNGHQPGACQDALTKLGGEGLPVMVLYGTEDSIQDGDVAVKLAKEYFVDFTAVSVLGAGHAVFYDALNETVRHLVGFGLRVCTKK
ncbi:AB hydrolase-1 domain-containing protein [Mycena indigotica]|uniref:AB hydrolase-1 domain-containing protein n=1 Tax=Mycena indigotica TaxID=2126181 RepID=A0A8H6S0V7_9AGAR|nr:AB hydrolase-1 domain-containing protein [Mycena indigotica]KAF7289240.1 AB hydrolase-1 domain-containing protein [Mycena indigotica]